MSKYDLHSHSTFSDGSLNPEQLVLRAKKNGVEVLALTDHDNINGLSLANKTAYEVQIKLINGVEISTTWSGQTIHVVGLNIAINNCQLIELLDKLQKIRASRGLAIGEKLEKYGINNAILETNKLVKGGLLTRSHYGQFLYQAGFANSIQNAFKKYLLVGRPGYVAGKWISLSEVVSVIHAAGGLACIAHPKRYRATNTKLNRLFAEFATAGGDAIEVVNANSPPQDIKYLSECAIKYNFSASLGSDFHTPTKWLELGRLRPIPKINRAIYDSF